MSKALDYRRDIDGLRALAVVPVVLHHAELPGFSGGYIGVDIFFVISGFLITGIIAREIQDGRFSILGFYERRARRILPALMVVLAATFFAGLFLLSPWALKSLGAGSAATAMFVSNIWFWRDAVDYFGTNAVLNPLLHTWSLAVEEQFYIVVPIVMMALYRYLPNRVFIGIGAISLLSFVESVYLVSSYPTAAFYILPSRLWELGVGSLLALGTFGVRRDGTTVLSRSDITAAALMVRNILSVSGLASILIAVVVYTPATAFPGFAALVPCLGTAAIIWAGPNAWANRLLSYSPLVWIGLISYSLYLWHWPLIAYLNVLYVPSEIPNALLAVAVIAPVGLATLSLYFIERPFRQGRLRALPRNTVLGGSVAALVAVMAAGGGVIALDGFSQNLPKVAQIAYAAKRDRGADKIRCEKLERLKMPCAIGAFEKENKSAELFLWGDSHAAAARPGVSMYLRRMEAHGFSMTHNGCAPLMGIERRGNEGGAECSGFNATVLETLRARTDIDTVLLVGRWALYTEGIRIEQKGKKPIRLVDVTEPSGDQTNEVLFEKGLTRTVDAILKLNKRVVILGSVPEIGWNVPELLGRHFQLGVQVPAVPTAEDYDARNKRAEAVLRRLAQREGVIFIDIANTLCRPNCAITGGEIPLYVDDDHLSKTGAELILPDLLVDAIQGKNSTQSGKENLL